MCNSHKYGTILSFFEMLARFKFYPNLAREVVLNSCMAIHITLDIVLSARVLLAANQPQLNDSYYDADDSLASRLIVNWNHGKVAFTFHKKQHRHNMTT